MAETVAWYLALLIVGAAGLVPAVRLFPRLDSRGIFVARPLAMALAALATWLAVHLTPLAYGTPVVLATLGVLLAWGAWTGWRRPEVVRALTDRWRRIVIAEALFLVLFAGVALLRGGTPGAWATEKPVDLMFLTAVHRAETFPPPDPWLASERLSYYHLGQVQMDALARLSGNPPEVAFNLSTATAAAAAGVAVVGLSLDIVALGGVVPLRRRRRVALATSGVALGGLFLAAPLVGLVQIASANGLGGERAWGWLHVDGVPTTGGAWGLVPEAFWWWWPTTRSIPDVIAEYPAFTVLLGDPHAHFFAVPLGMVALALGVQVFEGGTPLTWRWWTRRPEELLLTAGVFAALMMTNSWDVITYGVIWGLAAWWATARTGWAPLLAWFIAIRWAAVPAAVALVLAVPFMRTVDPNPLGLAPVVGEYSDPGRWLLVWLPVLAPALAAIAVLRPPSRRWLPAATGVAVIPVALWGGWLIGVDEGNELWARAWGWITLAALVGALGWCGAGVALADARDRATGAALAVLGAGILVLLVTELAHVDDDFPGRLNTAFKLWFHAWAIFAVASAALVGRAVVARADAAHGTRGAPEASTGGRGGNKRAARLVWSVVAVCGVVWLASMLTAPAMAVSREREWQERGLSAIAYLDDTDPALAAAVAWARVNLDPERHVLAQAIGEAYSTGDLLAAFTAVPTVLGWPGHERQWRGEIAEDGRRAAITDLYTGTREEIVTAAGRWGITHVYVGAEERAAYGPNLGAHFEGWPLVFSSDGGRIYAIAPPDEGAP